jgi:glutamate N-acetyltransferase / amino-acid N-acetyltransferase
MGITTPQGFRAAATAAGIKRDPRALDLALIAADQPCTAAAVFTSNLAKAAPVLVSREHIESGLGRAVIVNAGCANAGTGEGGLADAREMAALTAKAVGCRPAEVLVASTGVIGVRLPIEKLRRAIPVLSQNLSETGGAEAARAIMTTDTYPKEVAVDVPLKGGTVRIGGMAKGAGMIAPNMATMLAFFTTDLNVAQPLLQRALRDAVGATLNRITVDGDTSTNDCAFVLASGRFPAEPIADGEEFRAFAQGLTEAARRLAELLIRDGEGATRVAEVHVEAARTAADADRVARTVADSPLVKTALNGGDANWGRILAAVGRAGVALEIDRVDIHLGDVWVAEAGQAREYDESEATRAFSADPVRIRVVLNLGEASGTIWTCDLSHGYVDINGSYRS